MKDVCRSCGEVKRVKLYEGENYCNFCSKLINSNSSIQSDNLVIEIDHNEYLPKYKRAYTKALRGLGIYSMFSAITLYVPYALHSYEWLFWFIIAFIGLAIFLYVKSEIMNRSTLLYQQGVLTKHPTIAEEASRYGLRSTLVLNKQNLSSYNLDLNHLLGNSCEVLFDLNSNTNIKSARPIQGVPMLYQFTRNWTMISKMTYLYSICLVLITMIMIFSENLFLFFLFLLQLFALILNYTILVDDCTNHIIKNEELEDVFIGNLKIPLIKRINRSQKLVLYLGLEDLLHKKHQIVVSNSFDFLVKGVLLADELVVSENVNHTKLIHATSTNEDEIIQNSVLGTDEDFNSLLKASCIDLSNYEYSLVSGIAKELYINGLEIKRAIDIPLKQVIVSRKLFNKEL
jgi:hypothetical protein